MVSFKIETRYCFMEKHSSCLKIEVNNSYKEKKFVFKYETEPKFLRSNSERKSLFNGYNLWIYDDRKS